MVFATIIVGPFCFNDLVKILLNSLILVHLKVFLNPQDFATFSSSVLKAVAVGWYPVCAHISLSQTIMIKFTGLTLPIVERVPRFINNDPSPSIDITFSDVFIAIPRAIEEHNPIEP
ncbi:uncharacterized protein METZ01_LOCUS54150 [marine metagenome]|uniref:Uncharacterized protein n=1 Tax=marine metagenome TaxID=408172 RepID=A0A381SB97_9ZZZZ